VQAYAPELLNPAVPIQEVLSVIAPVAGNEVLLAGAAALFIRSPQAGTPRAQFVSLPLVGATMKLCNAVNDTLEPWREFPAPGLLVRVGEILWFALSGGLGAPAWRLTLAWRGSQ
jgi:hypothetical protein